jgi:hypothetical protein
MGPLTSADEARRALDEALVASRALAAAQAADGTRLAVLRLQLRLARQSARNQLLRLGRDRGNGALRACAAAADEVWSLLRRVEAAGRAAGGGPAGRLGSG